LNEAPEPAAEKPPEPTTDQRPIAPRPTTLIAGLIIAGVLVYNLKLDAASETYNGSWLTYSLAIGLCGVLGFDLSRFWPGGRDR
jgi:hypothetical protein